MASVNSAGARGDGRGAGRGRRRGAWPISRRGGALGFDPERIALVGHSAGAHLVALVGTDPAYLRGAGLSFADIDGVVPLDGAAYNVPRQLKEGPRIMGQTYRQAFGSDAARQERLSPTAHAAAPNAAEFLILHVQREDGIRQSEALGAALRRAGTGAEVQRLRRHRAEGTRADRSANGRSRISGDGRARPLPGPGYSARRAGPPAATPRPVPSLTTLLAFALGYPRGRRPSVRSPGTAGRHPMRRSPTASTRCSSFDFYSAGEGERPLVGVASMAALGSSATRRSRLADMKAPFARGEGWHFASLNFRLVPEVGGGGDGGSDISGRAGVASRGRRWAGESTGGKSC